MRLQHTLLWSCVLLATLHVISTWRHDRQPRIYGDKIPHKALMPFNRKVQKKIVTYHNFFRTHVAPPAADMLSMTWHKGAAKAAQKWANKCLLLQHDGEGGRWIDDFGSCGQNIFISSHKVPWLFAVKSWYLEKHNFTYGSSRNNIHVVGHYTQMVWAPTHKVGCGYNKCSLGGNRKQYYTYICNYCPIGNVIERLGRPYKKGAPCSKCADHCRMQKLCTNSCPTADLWANCRDLNATWNEWLCHNHEPDGRERHKFCKATCNCVDKIFN